jgi:2-polyprenyl-3-methyl-5-hydroxy-6-metoxy-1,4-benzoquinol methylase
MLCKFCSSETDLVFENGLECRSCKTVQVQIIPSDQVITDYYLNFNKNYTGGGPAENQIKYAIKYFKLVRSFCKNINEVLDIGCSNSPFPNLVSKENIKVSVLDVVKPKVLDDRIFFYQGLLDNQFSVPESKKFDVITAWAVIEHCKDVDLSLFNISKSLETEGYFFLTTPEIGTFLTKFNMGRTPWFFPPEHLHILSPKCLAIIGDKFGLKLVSHGHFEISKIRYFIRYYIIGGIETIIGFVVKLISKKMFLKIKSKRLSSFKGIQFMVFKKYI